CTISKRDWISDVCFSDLAEISFVNSTTRFFTISYTSACSRAVIHEEVYDIVKNRVVELTNEISAGDPATNEHFTGSVIDRAAYEIGRSMCSVLCSIYVLY